MRGAHETEASVTRGPLSCADGPRRDRAAAWSQALHPWVGALCGFALALHRADACACGSCGRGRAEAADGGTDATVLRCSKSIHMYSRIWSSATGCAEWYTTMSCAAEQSLWAEGRKGT